MSAMTAMTHGPGRPTAKLAAKLAAGFNAMLAAMLLLGPAAPAQAVQLGQPIPEVLLDTPDGPRQLWSAQARLTYVDFWASWCGPCRQSFPWMNAMQAKYGASGLRIVAVSVDARRADADEFLVRNPATFAVAFDRTGAFAKSTDVKTMPTSMLLDHRGRVLLVHQGFAHKDRETLEAAIAEALRDAAAGGKP